MPAFELRREVPVVNVTREQVESAMVFRLEGRLTIESDTRPLDDVLSAMGACEGGHVVLDLTHVRQLDCSGIGWLVRLRNEACKRGDTFALVDADPFQKQVLELLGLLRVFRVFDSPKDALAWSRNPARPADGLSFVPFDAMPRSWCVFF